MSLELTSITNSDKPAEEFVRLKATADVNISKYAVVDNTFDNKGNKTNVYRHFYRFPSMTIKKGDFIRLYTGKGPNSPYNNDVGTITHQFYWGSKECVWNDSGSDAAELLLVQTIDTKRAPRD